MAPALTESAVEPSTFSYANPSTKKFPDGIKTSGQFSPEAHLLKPYDQFPKEITGPTIWDAEDYQTNPERWTHHFSEEEVKEMSDAADAFMASETPLTGITKVRSADNPCRIWGLISCIGSVPAPDHVNFPRVTT